MQVTELGYPLNHADQGRLKELDVFRIRDDQHGKPPQVRVEMFPSLPAEPAFIKLLTAGQITPANYFSDRNQSSAAPSTPGYVGVYQFVAGTVLVPFGLSRDAALVYILAFQTITYGVVLFRGQLVCGN